MNNIRITPFLIGLAAMMLVSLACVLTPNITGEPPFAPTAVSLPEVTSTPESQIAVAPTSSSNSEIGELVEFSEADCACGDLTVSKAFPWGEALECRYDWSGANIDDNKLGFQLARDYHVEEWDDKFSRDRDDMEVEFSGGATDQAVNEFMNSQDAYGFMSTSQGWSRNDVEIPVCGFGKSEELYAGEWLIHADLRSCEAPNSMEGYLAQIQMVQDCARDLIDAKMK